MISFASDYSEGCHPKILEAFIKSNYKQLAGYGADEHTSLARQKIRDACHKHEADVFFLVGGTQTNQLMIDTLLESYQGIIALDTSHISHMEAGAIEYSGHKILLIEGKDGKIDASSLENYCQNFYQDKHQHHRVQPGAVFLTFPTELGTVYSKKELEDIYRCAKQFSLKVYIDGARLGYGLMSKESDVNLQDIAEYSDAFYIGGTKLGALCGEAVVFPRGDAPKHFFTIIKQHGALLAKSRLLGISFEVLFTEDLYFRLAQHANRLAQYLEDGFRKKGYIPVFSSTTNQKFFWLTEAVVEELKIKGFIFTLWQTGKQENIYRFVTSWATQKQQVDALLKELPSRT